MHCAWAISDVFMVGVIGGFPCGLRRADISPWQEVQAVLNAGDCMLIDGGIAIPPIMFSAPVTLVPGSGKFGTPCSRTHLANASCAAATVGDVVALFGALLPHPAATTQAVIVPRTAAMRGPKAIKFCPALFARPAEFRARPVTRA